MTFKNLRLSLAAKFSLFIPLPVLIASLALSSSFIGHNLGQLETATIERGMFAVRALALSSEYGLLVENEEMLNDVIEMHIDEEDLFYIIIRNIDGDILANYGDAHIENKMKAVKTKVIGKELPSQSDLNYSISETEIAYNVQCDVVTIQDNRSREDIGLPGMDVMPITKSSRNRIKIGTVQLGISKAPMLAAMRAAAMRAAAMDAFWLTGGAIILTVLVTVLLIRLMMRPVKALATAAGEVSRGNFDHPVEVNSRDEMGDLANSFNKMVSKLKESRESLQTRLETERRMSMELQQKTSELSYTNKELDAFVYTVSHDLKAPLVSLQGFSGLLIKDCGDDLNENGRMYVERIQKNSENMGILIENLLELSRAGRTANQNISVNVSEVISEVVESYAMPLEKRGTKLIIRDEMPTIYCDRTRLSQIFANLISNANKYIGDNNPEPRIELGYISQNGYHKFYVKDNGIGIDEQYHDYVFGILKRLNEAEAEGTGIGLAIVKKIIENFGGSIDIDSEVGKGTTMYFTVPKEKSAEIENIGNNNDIGETQT